MKRNRNLVLRYIVQRFGALALVAMPNLSLSDTLMDRFHIGNSPFSEAAENLSFFERRALSRSLAKFSVVEDCTVQLANQVHFINWSAIETLADLRVCVFVVAEYLNGPEELVDWLEENSMNATVHDIFGNWPSEREGTVHATLSPTSVDTHFRLTSEIGLVLNQQNTIAIGVNYRLDGSPFSSTAVANNK